MVGATSGLAGVAGDADANVRSQFKGLERRPLVAPTALIESHTYALVEADAYQVRHIAAAGVLVGNEDLYFVVATWWPGTGLARPEVAGVPLRIGEVLGAGPPVMAAETSARLIPVGSAFTARTLEATILVVEGQRLEPGELGAQPAL